MTERPRGRAGILRLAVTFGGAAAMLVTGAFTYAAMERTATDRALVVHTHDVIDVASATLAAAQDAETGQRGYLITGDTAYLEPYASALGLIAADTLALRELTRDNPSQQRRLDTLDQLMARKLTELDETIALRRAGAQAEVERIVRSGRGKALMDSIRGVLGRLADEERHLLAIRQASAARSARIAVAVLIAGTLAAIICALVLNGMLSRYAKEQSRTADRLREQNDLLGEQAVELETQAEELQLQATELEMANENLEEQVGLAEAANKAKSEFLASMSHELRTPLNAIDGYTELLLLGVRGPVTDAQHADITRIKKSSRHLLTLINQVLNQAKIESGHIDLELASIPVQPLLQDVEVLIQPQMTAKGIAFSVGECDEALRIFGDADRVKQILLNLVSNAQKFTDPGGTVTLRCSAAGDGRVVMSVSDTGRGIPVDKLTEVFEPFTQLNRLQTPDSHRGIGLGLSISRTLARAMRGDLVVESEVGKGSTFRLTLPDLPAG